MSREFSYNSSSSKGEFLALSERASKLERLMRTWSELLGQERGWCHGPDDFCDAPWWYNEQATLSHLAGAAWTIGGTALQEYSTFKSIGRLVSRGRGDLWISLDQSRPGGFLFEAKQIWPRFTHLKKDVKTASTRLNAACKDALKNHPSDIRVGLCLIAPRLSKQRFTIFSERSHQFIEELLEATHPDFIVAAWRRETKVPTSKSRIYPGIIVIGRIPQD